MQVERVVDRIDVSRSRISDVGTTSGGVTHAKTARYWTINGRVISVIVARIVGGFDILWTGKVLSKRSWYASRSGNGSA